MSSDTSIFAVREQLDNYVLRIAECLLGHLVGLQVLLERRDAQFLIAGCLGDLRTCKVVNEPD